MSGGLPGLPPPRPIPLKDRASLIFVERARLMVVVVSNAPPRLRGRPAAWLVELRAGVCVGDYSARTREMIREQVEGGIARGGAVMVWKAPTDQGYAFRTLGRNRRMPVDFDGLNLVAFRD